MPRYFDIHSHLNSPDYDSDREEVVLRLKETDTHTIVIGTDFESSKIAADLAGKYEEIYACIGIHPADKLESFKVEKFESLIQNPKVVAVGECGMDFFHADKNADYERQKKLFLDQISFAIAHNKPVMIHARDAYEELLEILEPMKKEYGKELRGNVHFFAGSVGVAKRFFDMRFTVSFTGVITFTHDYDEVIRCAPLHMIMSETDAPYVTPIPYRGKRNEPNYVSEVVKKIAEIRREGEEVVRIALVNNALSMIG
ncbi:MAG: TatD family hydrolase [Patescibacteria group bacterium]|nr:TatD family hydrolase [Patescibacteria group bacterium]